MGHLCQIHSRGRAIPARSAMCIQVLDERCKEGLQADGLFLWRRCARYPPSPLLFCVASDLLADCCEGVRHSDDCLRGG